MVTFRNASHSQCLFLNNCSSLALPVFPHLPRPAGGGFAASVMRGAGRRLGYQRADSSRVLWIGGRRHGQLPVDERHVNVRGDRFLLHIFGSDRGADPSARYSPLVYLHLDPAQRRAHCELIPSALERVAESLDVKVTSPTPQQDRPGMDVLGAWLGKAITRSRGPVPIFHSIRPLPGSQKATRVCWRSP